MLYNVNILSILISENLYLFKTKRWLFMNKVLSKKQMTEEDIKLHYITPSIKSKWDPDKITMETRITDGKINIRGNLKVREKP